MGDKIYPKNGIYFPPCLYIRHARVSYKWFFKWDFLKNGAWYKVYAINIWKLYLNWVSFGQYSYI